MATAARLSSVPKRYYVILCIAVLLQAIFWWHARTIRIPWAGVGPPPPETVVRVLGLGEAQFAYRAGGLALQQLGDFGGQVTPLSQYDYTRLIGWLDVLVRLDRKSNYVPTLAGYYFGHSRVPAQARKVALFLRDVAVASPQTHWRWLAHAVYLARHQAKDMPLALDLAAELRALPASNLPIWARQLEAFVLADVGEKEAARDIMEVLIATNPDLPDAEQTFMKRFIEQRLGFPALGNQ